MLLLQYFLLWGAVVLTDIYYFTCGQKRSFKILLCTLTNICCRYCSYREPVWGKSGETERPLLRKHTQIYSSSAAFPSAGTTEASRAAENINGWKWDCEITKQFWIWETFIVKISNEIFRTGAALFFGRLSICDFTKLKVLSDSGAKQSKYYDKKTFF